MKKLRVGVFGIRGRMGREVAKVLRKNQKAVLWSLDKRPDLVIEFSSPAGLLQCLEFCVKNNVPLVSGTTGLSSKEKSRLRAASKKIPIFYSPNLSLGVNAFLESLKNFAKTFPAQKVRIEETHHIHKKDKPSGTAKMLYEELVAVLPRSTKVLKPVSYRVQEVFGIHKVTFEAENETVSFEHTAHGRQVFATGAVQAALWLSKQKRGIYDMQDLLHGKR